MGRPRKSAEDLVPDENPLDAIADAEAGVDAPEPEGAAEAEPETGAGTPEREEPAADEAVADAPVDEPVADAAEEPPADEPVAEEPAAEQPRVDEAGAETPVADEPVAEESVDEPAAEAPAPASVAEEPATPEEPAAPPVARAPEKPRKSRAERKARVRPKRRGAAAATGERKPIVRLPKPEHERGQRKERRGVVVSNAMEKTIVVRVDTAKPDRRYKKVVRRSRKFHAHDERNEANVGDIVRIVETRPLSKTKTWRLAEVVEAAR